jgi:hypothetical protein
VADVRVEVILSQDDNDKVVTRTCYVPGDLMDHLSGHILGAQHDAKQDTAQHTVGASFVDAYRELVESDRT